MKVKRSSMVLVAIMVALGAVWAVAPASAQGGPPDPRHHDRGQQRGKRPHGDPVVRKGLVAATASVTSQRVRQVRQELAAGKSIEAIAQAAGKSAADVLARFDAAIDKGLARRAERGRLPQAVVEARAAWFKQSARLQIDQPGLDPAFPGLHEVHVVMIGAAVEVSGIPRSEVRAALETCQTLAAIVATKGKSGADVASEAMARFDAQLQAGVANGSLTTAQRDEWRAALRTATTNMTTTPGLHVAGKECA